MSMWTRWRNWWLGAPSPAPDASEMLRELAACSPDELPRVDERVRMRWRSAYREPLFEAELEDAPGLFSFHPDGHLREAAVRRLAESRDGSELPYLLLRLGDWVPQVRAAARQAVLDRFESSYAVAFARNFSLVDRLARIERSEYPSLIEPLARLLAGAPATVVDVLASGSRNSRRALVRFVIAHVPQLLAEVVRAGATADDDLIRMWITPYVESVPLLERLADDGAPAVRRAALATLARSFPSEAKPLLERAVFDASAAVRESARTLLGEPRERFVSLYRDAIGTASSTRELTSAIAGLSELASASDADLAVPHLSHPSARVRRAAVKCVMRLGGERFADPIADMLGDPSAGVAAAARNALRPHAAALGRQRLMQLFAAARPPCSVGLRPALGGRKAGQRPALHGAPHTQKVVIPLLAALPKWASIIALLEAVPASDDELRPLAQRFIAAWNLAYNRSQTVPSRHEIAELTAALAAAEPLLDARTAREIRFAAAAFTR